MKGIGLPGLLTVIFVIAKLAGVINWSWWLVLAPALLSAVVGLAVFAFIIGVAVWSEGK